MNAFVRILHRVYSQLLRFYPPRFRDEFGAEMQAVFRQAVVQAVDSGWVPLARLCWREARDWPAAVLLARRLGRTAKERPIMDNSMVTGSRRPTWFFYLGWIVLSAISIPVAGAIAWAIISQVQNVVGGTIEVGGRSRFTEDFLADWVLFPMLGLVTGLLQYLMLRRYVSRAGWWIVATVLGWTLPFALIGPVFAGLGREVGTVLSAALLGGLIALPQWWILRRRARHAGWWLVASFLGWGFVGLLTGPTSITSLDVMVAAIIPAIAASATLWLLLDRLPGREPGGLAPGQ